MFLENVLVITAVFSIVVSLGCIVFGLRRDNR